MAGTLPAARAQLRDLPLAGGGAHEDPHDVAPPLEVRRAQADAVVAVGLAHAALDQPDELAGPRAAPQLDFHARLLAQAIGDDERALLGAPEGLPVEPERPQRRPGVGL